MAAETSPHHHDAAQLKYHPNPAYYLGPPQWRKPRNFWCNYKIPLSTVRVIDYRRIHHSRIPPILPPKTIAIDPPIDPAKSGGSTLSIGAIFWIFCIDTLFGLWQCKFSPPVSRSTVSRHNHQYHYPPSLGAHLPGSRPHMSIYYERPLGQDHPTVERPGAYLKQFQVPLGGWIIPENNHQAQWVGESSQQ